MVAYHWEGEPDDERRAISYADLQRDVVQLANALEGAWASGKGTQVAIYMGMVPELPVAMLACTRLGAPHTVVFGGFSADSLSGRINDMGCEVLITQDEALAARLGRAAQADGRRGARDLPRRAQGGRAAAHRRRRGHDGRAATTGGTSSPPTRTATPPRAPASRWTRRTCSSSCTRAGRPRSRRASRTRPAATSSASRRRTTTSSTSSPITSTGARPTSAGSPATATSSTARSATATTSVIYEGTPDFPDKDRWWSIVERYGVDILYTAPTAIRAHMKWGPEYAERHDLSSLRLLGSVGEPINPEAWIWYREHIGGDRCPVVDTWWQTETGMILITPLPGRHDDEARARRRSRSPGVDAAVDDEHGNEVGPGGGGYLVLRRPWPAMLRGIYRRPRALRGDLLVEVPGNVYFAGDGARIDEDGDFWLLGRVDDVMNVSGHRISTIEVESALVDHPEVAEAAVCGRNDAQTGQAIVAYVTLKGDEEGSIAKLEELRNHVAHKIGPIAKPANIVFTPELPKTRSGKIMRRLLRDVAENRTLGDTTTLADPAVVEEIKQRRVRRDERGVARRAGGTHSGSRARVNPCPRGPSALAPAFDGSGDFRAGVIPSCDERATFTVLGARSGPRGRRRARLAAGGFGPRARLAVGCGG